MGKQTAGKIQEKLENSVLKGLQMEWNHIHKNIPKGHRHDIRLPQFTLFDGKAESSKSTDKGFVGRGTLAHWNENRYMISFRRSFVLNAEWGFVCDVLAHEMAHQLAATFEGSKQETAHGPLFQKACTIVKADPAASSYINYYAPRSGLAVPQKQVDKLIKKVKKLMQLAESKNEHEASAAAAKANDLITRYNLNILDQNQKQQYISVHLGTPQLRQAPGAYEVTHILEKHYFVQIVWISSWVKEKEKMGHVAEATGTPSNIEIASYVHDYIHNYINTQWEAYKKSGRVQGNRKASFARGIAKGFMEKLLQQQKTTVQDYTQTSGKELVTLTDRNLDKHVTDRYSGLQRFSRKTSVDPSTYDAGKQAGQNLNISRGVHHKSGNKGLLLTG